MEKIYRLIGIKVQIHGKRDLEFFGQKVSLSDELAKDLILGAGSAQAYAGASPLLPDHMFQQIFGDMDPKELAHCSIPANQTGDRAADFLERRGKAFLELDAYRMTLESEAAADTPTKETLNA